MKTKKTDDKPKRFRLSYAAELDADRYEELVDRALALVDMSIRFTND